MDTLLLMNRQIPVQSTLDDLKRIPSLGLDFLSKPPLTDFTPYTGSGLSRLSVPTALASFFIEAFAVEQPAGQQLNQDKRFDTPTVLKFRFPAIFPVACESVPTYVNFGFFDTPIATAVETCQLLRGVLDSMSRVPTYVVEFREVDREVLTAAAVSKLARDFGVVVLLRQREANPEFETVSATVNILLSHWSDERDLALKAGIRGLFDRAFVGFCAECGNVFSPNDGGECITTKHRGKRIPVCKGQFEIVEIDEDDQPIYIEKYECCGEVYKGSTGCLRAAHRLDRSRVLSSHEIRLANALAEV
jgi:hypothetical protein